MIPWETGGISLCMNSWGEQSVSALGRVPKRRDTPGGTHSSKVPLGGHALCMDFALEYMELLGACDLYGCVGMFSSFMFFLRSKLLEVKLEPIPSYISGILFF